MKELEEKISKKLARYTGDAKCQVFHSHDDVFLAKQILQAIAKAEVEIEGKEYVVRLVPVELPKNPYGDDVHLDAGKYDGLYKQKYQQAQQDMLKVMKPLVEER